MKGKKEDDLSPFMIEAVGLLATWVKPVIQFGCLTDDVLDRRTVKKIEDGVTEESKRKAISRFIHASIDKEKIAGWKQELHNRLQLFNVCPAVVTWS